MSKYTQEDLDKTLDQLMSGPIGQRKEWQWDKSIYGTVHLSSKEIRAKASKKSGDTQRGKKRGPRSQETIDKLSKAHKGRKMPWLYTEEVMQKKAKSANKVRKAVSKAQSVGCIISKDGKDIYFSSFTKAAEFIGVSTARVVWVAKYGKPHNKTGGYNVRYA